MKCENPFFPCEGKSNRTALDIIFKGERLTICEDCWSKIADSDIQWENPHKTLPPEPKEDKLQLNKVEVKLRKLRSL